LKKGFIVGSEPSFTFEVASMMSDNARMVFSEKL